MQYSWKLSRGKYWVVIQRLAGCLGIPRRNSCRLTAADLVSPERIQQLPAVIEQELSEGGAFFKTHNRRKDGHIFPVEVNAKTFMIGAETQVIVYIRDLTERDDTEKALRENMVRFRTLFETAPVSIFLSNPQGQILEVNQVALDMLGSPSADATKAVNMLNFQPLIQAGFSASFQKCVDTGKLVTSECPYTSKWGKSIYIRYYITPILDLDGQVSLVQTIAEDISEHIEAEKALRESDARLRSIFATTPDFIYTLDRSLKIQYINHVMKGLTQDTVIGISGLAFISSEFRESAKAIFESVFQDGQIQNYTSLYQLAPEGPRWYETNIGPIFDGNGDVEAAMLVSRDITERKIADEKIRSLNLGLERQAEQLTLLYDAGLALNRILDPREQLEYLAKIIIQALHADNSGFFRYDPDRDQIDFEFGVGQGIESGRFSGFSNFGGGGKGIGRLGRPRT